MNSRSSRTKRLLKLAALKFKETQDYSNYDAIQETIETENKENILQDNLPPVNLDDDKEGRILYSSLGRPNPSPSNFVKDQEVCTNLDSPNLLQAKLVEYDSACNPLEDQEAYTYKASCSSDFPNVLPANLVKNVNACTNEASSSLGRPNLSPASLWEDQEVYTYKASCSSNRPMVLRFQRLEGNKYTISPIHSGESDVDDSDADPHYNNSTSESDTDREGNPETMMKEDDSNQEENKEKGKKRKANPEAWSFKKAKYLRNSEKAYTTASKNKKKFCEKKVRPPCGDKCRLQCNKKIDEEARKIIFSSN
ncbi:unnamed protein product [Ceutorhynchus assimilis]|uniref:Uncharacterized protein n=1 Tax=Ceutorhynchus assimilis TaxID=467358 RepID=A0A9N9Q8R3_9CUCU|nr:unnamed protein product [Ceutorhynchus assimilis]